jgi:anthranilate synthase component 1
MLLDLGRNDLGRVSEPSSVKVTASFVIERYSHVMHLVSQVESTLRKELDFLDLLRASFPAGTVTGAPKVRAMQLIEEVEKVRRGPYAGALGYVNYQGDMDFCILIRTLFHHGETLIAHTGAGIVADSEPGREYEETVNKAMALFKTVDLLKGIEGWLPSYL